MNNNTTPTMYWISHKAGQQYPVLCEICKSPCPTQFVDGATSNNSWALMCVPCHNIFGRGLGTGRGQRYERLSHVNPDHPNRYYRVEG